MLGAGSLSATSALLTVFRNMFPDNVAAAAVDMNILGVITFSLLFGLGLASLGPQADSFIAAVDVRPASTCLTGHELLHPWQTESYAE